MGVLDKIQQIEAEMARTQKNKATEYHLGLLKAKLARYRAQLIEAKLAASGGKPGEGFDVIKSGDARVALIGFPSVGKSTLLSELTNTSSQVAAYEFTTLSCVPGVIHYRGAEIQLLDLPGIIEGASQGKGRGKQVIAVARNSDMIMMLLDAAKADSTQREKLENELEAVGIRLNKQKPDWWVRLLVCSAICEHINDKSIGSVGCVVAPTSFKSDHCLCQFRVRQPDKVQQILHEYRIFNAEVLFREDATTDEFIDVVVGNRVYVPCLYVYNKIDQVSIEEVNRLARRPNSVVASCNMKLNLDNLLLQMWKYLNLIQIYTKKRGEPPDLADGIVVRNGSNVGHVCGLIHKSLRDNFKYALVWGTSAKFSPQRVGPSHKLHNEDVIQIFSK